MRHATIIGAGIIGTSTAAFLQREGFSVTVVDRLPPGEGVDLLGDAGARGGEAGALLRDLGFQAYRFSVEWARIEPEEGRFSVAAAC